MSMLLYTLSKALVQTEQFLIVNKQLLTYQTIIKQTIMIISEPDFVVNQA